MCTGKLCHDNAPNVKTKKSLSSLSVKYNDRQSVAPIPSVTPTRHYVDEAEAE